MASRFFFSNKLPDRIIGTLPNWGWENSVPCLMLDDAKGGTAATISTIETVKPGPTNVLLYRGITRKIGNEFFIDDPAPFYGVNFNAMVEANFPPDAVVYGRVMCYTVSYANPTAPPVYQTHIIYQEDPQSPGYELKTPNWWTQVISGDMFSGGFGPANFPFDFKDYRIVLEIGVTVVRPSAGAVRISSMFGARANDWTFLPNITPIANLPAPSAAVGFLDVAPGFNVLPFTYGFNNHEPEFADLLPSPGIVSLNPSFPTDRWWVTSPVNKIITVRICNPAFNNLYNTLDTYEATTPSPPYTPLNSGFALTEKISTSRITNIRVQQNVGGGVTNLILEDVLRGTVQPGDFLLPDDVYGPNPYDLGIPAGITQFYTPAGIIRHYDAKIGSLRVGVSLGDGRFAGIVERVSPITDLFISYGPAPAFVTFSGLSYTQDVFALGTDFKVYYLISGTSLATPNASIQKINPDASGGITLTLPVGKIGTASDLARMTVFGVSRDSRVVYYGGGVDKLIHRYDIIANGALASFTLRPPAQFVVGDIIVMSDDSIVAVWIDNSTTTPPISAFIYHYASDGSILHQYPAMNVQHIVHEFDDSPNKVWIRSFLPSVTGTLKFDLLNLVDGSILKSFTLPVNIAPNLGCSPVEQQIGLNAGLVMMMAKATDFGGIYYINTRKADYADDYIGFRKKIPDPTAKTAFLGE